MTFAGLVVEGQDGRQIGTRGRLEPGRDSAQIRLSGRLPPFRTSASRSRSSNMQVILREGDRPRCRMPVCARCISSWYNQWCRKKFIPMVVSERTESHVSNLRIPGNIVDLDVPKFNASIRFRSTTSSWCFKLSTNYMNPLPNT